MLFRRRIEKSINHSKAEDEHVLHLLDAWKGVANLKKAVANIQR